MKVTIDFKKTLRDFVLREIEIKGQNQTQYAAGIGLNTGYITMIKDEHYWDKITDKKWIELAEKTGLEQSKDFTIEWSGVSQTREIPILRKYLIAIKNLQEGNADNKRYIHKGMFHELLEKLNELKSVI